MVVDTFRAGASSRRASARHARSPSESPASRVNARRRPASMASAAVNGSTVIAPSSSPLWVSSAASFAGSPPRSATRLNTSARLTVEITAPLAIASATTSAPGSSRRCARSAEASSTGANYSVSSRAASARRSASSSSTIDPPGRPRSSPRLCSATARYERSRNEPSLSVLSSM